MATGYAPATGWGNTPDFDGRRYETQMNANYANRLPGTSSQQSLLASLSGAAPRGPQDNGFGGQQSAMDRFFQLKQAEALQQVAKRADNLSAARGLHIDGGVSTQMEQELGNEAIGQLNQQQAGANADLMAQQRAYAMQQQQLAMEKQQFDARMRASQQQQAYENQMKDKLYADMRNAGTMTAGGQGQAQNPFASTAQAMFQDGQSGTGSIIGGPAVSNSTFGQSNLTSSTGNNAFGTKAPDRVFTETAAEAAGRAKLNPRNGGTSSTASFAADKLGSFDYAGSPNKNTGGYQVPGVSSAGPSVSSLGRDFSTWANQRRA